MEIAYDSGAKVLLQGPATYEVESASGGFLSVGKLTASVGERGRGEGKGKGSHVNPSSSLATLPSPLFTVRTPTAIVTDLGTEFYVECNPSGETTSHVLRGLVKVQTAARSGEKADQSVILERKRVGPRRTIERQMGPASQQRKAVGLRSRPARFQAR